MRTVELVMSFTGEVFFMTVEVPTDYFFPDGKLNEVKLRNRLEGNGRVHTMKVLEEVSA